MHVWDWDFCLLTIFTVNICQYIRLRPVNISFYFPYFFAVFIFQPSQHGCSAAALSGAWFAGVTAPGPPTLDRRRVERERYFPWEWAVTPAG